MRQADEPKVWPSTVLGSGRGPDAPELVGREPELDALAAFLADRAGRPRGLVIEGPAGAGKTTLWRAAVEQAKADGDLVLSCRAASAEVHLSLSVLTDLLDPHLASLLPSVPPPQRRALEVALLLEDDGGHAPDERALFAGVLNAVRSVAIDRPVLIAIDDAQWVDQQSAEIVEFALRRLRDLPVAVLTTWRTESATSPASAPLRGLRLERAMDQAPAKLAVGPMSVGALHRLLRTRTNLSFNRRTLLRIHEASGGNPFYALELARAIERDPSPGEPLALSAGLNELLAERLTGLGEATQNALFVAAAASQPTIELLEAVTTTNSGALPSARVALQPAVDASIVRLDGETIEFTHPLLAAAAYSLPGISERRHWHQRLAEESTDPEAHARHLAMATPGRDAEVAESLHAAGRHARSRGAPAAAGELFAEAIGRLPDGQLELRAMWTVEAAPVLRQAGDLRQARLLLEAVIDELAAGPVRSDALLALSRLVEGDPGGDDLELVLIERALHDAGEDPARRAAALLSREMWERHQDRLDEALSLAREALALAEQADDDVLLAGALTRTADLEVLRGLSADPVATFERALRAGAHLQLDAKEDSAPAMLGVCLVRAGRIDEARALLTAERDRATVHGDESSLEILCLFLTELEWLAGDWNRARAHAEAGLLVADQADSRMIHGAISALLALVEGSRGQIESARARALRAVAVCEEVGDRSYATYAHHIAGFLELSAGNAAAAHEHLTTYPVERGIEGTKRIAFVGDEIEALVLLGRIEEAAALTDELARRGELLHRPTLSATAARCRGLVLGARGDLDCALISAEMAVRLSGELGLPFERARALLVLGDVQRRAKRRGAARETLTQAAAAFEALGAGLWSKKSADSLARVGGRTAIEGLSATELRVAQLVAEGRSNKEIAAELYVTVRAVEANLSKVYAKLGIRSRTEIARRI